MPKTRKSKKTSKAKPQRKSLVHKLKSRLTAGNIKVGLLVVVALVATTVVGYAGYAKYQEHKLKSKAAAYKQVLNKDGYTIGVCKTSTIYGYRLQAIATKPDYHPYSWAQLRITAANSWDSGVPSNPSNDPHVVRADASSSSWWGNVVTTTSAYAGNDSWSYTVRIVTQNHVNGFTNVYGDVNVFSNDDGTLTFTPISMAYTPNC